MDVRHSVTTQVETAGDFVSTTVLLIDGDPSVAIRVRAALEAEGHAVQAVATGREAQACLRELQPSLILLEIDLPDVDGLLLCGELLKRWSVPLIILSSSSRQSDRILSLRMGADDFILKPFHPHELAARVGAVLRRTQRATPPAASPVQDAALEPDVLRLGGLLLDDRRHRAMVNDAALDLTPSEYQLLSTFARDPERTWSRDALGEVLWGDGDASTSRAIDVHIWRLRSKLEAFGDHAPAIVTVRGFGYRLELR